MLYLVEAHPSVERANVVDAGEGPGPVIAKIVERFRPKAIYGNPSRRQVFMVVELDTPAKMAELMYVLAWFVDVEPTFTPLMSAEIYGEAIANAKKIIKPHKIGPPGGTETPFVRSAFGLGGMGIPVFLSRKRKPPANPRVGANVGLSSFSGVGRP